MGGEAEGDGAGVRPEATPIVDAAERARIDRVKQAVLQGRMLPERARRLDPWWGFGLGLLQFGAFLLPVIIAWCLQAALGLRLSGTWLLVAVLVSVAVSPIIAARLERIRGQRARRFLDAHQGFVCPRCHYVLTTCPSVGICPECGTLYTRSRVVDLWTEAYQLKHNWPRT